MQKRNAMDNDHNFVHMGVMIRKEVPADHEAVHEINKNAFGRDEEADLVNRLRSSESFVSDLSLVAISENVVVGHILFTKIRILNPLREVFESLALAPMAVNSTNQNRGIGSNLIKHGLSKATALGFDSVIVLGHERYYPKFGFVPASNFGIKAPFDVKDSAFMALELQVDSLKVPNGIVHYTKEFGI